MDTMAYNLRAAILKNDSDATRQAMRDVGLYGYAAGQWQFSLRQRLMMQVALNTAVTMAYANTLSEGMAYLVIEYAASAVDIFGVLNLVFARMAFPANPADAAGPSDAAKPGDGTNPGDTTKPADVAQLPAKLEAALRQNRFGPEVVRQIERLNRDELEAMLRLIASEHVTALNNQFSMWIISRMQELRLVPTDQLLLYLGASLLQDVEEAQYRLPPSGASAASAHDRDPLGLGADGLLP